MLWALARRRRERPFLESVRRPQWWRAGRRRRGASIVLAWRAPLLVGTLGPRRALVNAPRPLPRNDTIRVQRGMPRGDTMDGVTPELVLPPRILLGPGPSMADPRVLRAMSTPLLGQFDPDFTELMQEVMALSRVVFHTQNPFTFPVSGTRRAGLEAGIASV